MIITAEQAVAAVNAGHATVEGWTRGENDQRFAIVNNHIECRVDHVECGNESNETDCQRQVERLADACDVVAN